MIVRLIAAQKTLPRKQETRYVRAMREGKDVLRLKLEARLDPGMIAVETGMSKGPGTKTVQQAAIKA